MERLPALIANCILIDDMEQACRHKIDTLGIMITVKPHIVLVPKASI